MTGIDYITDRSAWEPEDLKQSLDWQYRLSSEDIVELKGALLECQKSITELRDISRDNFPLNKLSDTLNWVGESLENNRGIVIVKGLPIEQFTKEELRILYIGIGNYVGIPLKQSTQGEIIQDVYDQGENLYANSGRGTNSSNRLPWHTDRCDVVSLLCLNKSEVGGESKLASLTNVYNKIKQERPELAEVLCAPFCHGRAPFERDDAQPWYELPVFTQYEGKFASRYLRRFIEIAQEYQDVPRFSDLQVAALDYLDTRLDQADVCLDLPFERGDIQFLNNFTVCHSRNEYQDSEQHARFLFRLWLAAYRGRDLDPAFKPLYGATKGGQNRGGIWF